MKIFFMKHRMASKADKHRKKGKSSEWSKSGSFMNKPDRGWIHPDFQLDKEAGICYGVRVSILHV